MKILIGYRSGRLRVNIHTSNISIDDFVNGAFIQDFLPKSKNTNNEKSNSSSAFEETLIYYLESYGLLDKVTWGQEQTTPTTLVSHLKTYDFSTAVGTLIPSIPGYHKFGRRAKENKLCGYLKVEKAIRDTCVDKSCDNKSVEVHHDPIVCQFTSIGALDKKYLDKIATSWNAVPAVDNESSSSQNKNKKMNKDNASSNLLRFVWPTVDDIASSVEGLGVCKEIKFYFALSVC